MKDKKLTFDEWKIIRSVVPGEKKVFLEPPVSSISKPEGLIFFLTKTTLLPLTSSPSISFGIIAAVRLDYKDSPNIWNVDVYRLYNAGSFYEFILHGPLKDLKHKFINLPTDYIPIGLESSFSSLPSIVIKVEENSK